MQYSLTVWLQILISLLFLYCLYFFQQCKWNSVLFHTSILGWKQTDISKPGQIKPKLFTWLDSSRGGEVFFLNLSESTHHLMHWFYHWSIQNPWQGFYKTPIMSNRLSFLEVTCVFSVDWRLLCLFPEYLCYWGQSFTAQPRLQHSGVFSLLR